MLSYLILCVPFKKFDNCYVYISVSGLLSQVGSKYREELKKNLCIFGKSLGNNGEKRELVQKMHRLDYCVLN